jgi:diguanylate cyclase (GGDEF)-like protein
MVENDSQLRTIGSEETEERLTKDANTGLRNEYFFRLRLPDEFAAARRNESNASFLIIKIDNIISINSKHGRAGGDEALRAIAHELENCKATPARSSHSVFKLGGPLFGYYIPSASAPEARSLAEQIHDAVIHSELFIEKLSVSIGIVNFYEFFLEGGTYQDLALRIEQTALYRLSIAEQMGTNTICDSSDISEHMTSSKPLVLIVEPDPASIELLINALSAAGFDVHTCENGETAIFFIQSKKPSVIICAAMAPRIDGFTLRERLRANALLNAIPFILVSHKKNEELIHKAVERDIRHFFRKPISIEEIVGLITNITRSSTR